MSKNNRKLKNMVLAMVLMTGLLLPASALSQEETRHGGLFDFFGLFCSEEEETGLLRDGSPSPEENDFALFNQQFGSDQNGGYDLHNQTFGQNDDAPLGNGLLILAAAGAGYAFIRRKDNKKQ